VHQPEDRSAEWGDGVVEELAADLARRYPGIRGYTRPNLFRMRQSYEAYGSNRKVSPLVRQLPWTHHLIILVQAKPVETREFYILAAIKERWSKRELAARSGSSKRFMRQVWQHPVIESLRREIDTLEREWKATRDGDRRAFERLNEIRSRTFATKIVAKLAASGDKPRMN
jgi:hypothetical protein